MTKSNLKFEKLFKIATMSMRLNGSHPSIIRDTRWFIKFSIIMINTFCCCLFLIYSICCHDIKTGKFSEASKNGTMVIVSITITLKYMVLLYHQASIREIINIMEEDYRRAQDTSKEDLDIVVRYAERGQTVCKFWLVFGFGTSAIFPIKAFILMAYYTWKDKFVLVPLFDLTYPQPIEAYKNVTVVFWILFVVTFVFDVYASSMYVGFDPMLPIFMLHTCGQLDLLNLRISKLFVEAEDRAEIEEGLKKIICKLQDLYKLVDRVKKNYSILYEYNMKATTFLLPLTMFQIVEELRVKRINVEFISFFAASILHFFMPCYYSDLLMETSEKFRQAIYSCRWEKCYDKRIRQIVLFMMTRARIPMGITTVFYVINLDTFAEMCRQSYGIFNLMNAACE
uniref:Odorant receptor n=3 Tax=Helicoverpa TaxID=7112 RepID=A0A7T3KAH0_HELAM|nr:odorant receptor 67c [Helicoverpa armigera]QPX50361.1 odorant receptor [Helicoverpa armigera]